jgi:hypothetical protein
VLYTLLKRETARAAAAQGGQNHAGSKPTIQSLQTTLFDNMSLLHLAALWGYVSVARILLESGTSVNVYAKDAAGKTPLYRAAVNGQLRMLPVLLERVNPFDPHNQEALRTAFTDMDVLRPYRAEELLEICRDIVKTGFDMRDLAMELTELKDFLLDGGVDSRQHVVVGGGGGARKKDRGATDEGDDDDDDDGKLTTGGSPEELRANQLAKALTAMRIAMADASSSSNAAGKQDASSSSSPGLKKSKGKGDSEEERKKQLKASVEGYIHEMADRFRMSVEQGNYDVALTNELLQLATTSSRAHSHILSHTLILAKNFSVLTPFFFKKKILFVVLVVGLYSVGAISNSQASDLIDRQVTYGKR